MKKKLAFVNVVPSPEDFSAFATLVQAETLSQAAKRSLKPTTGELTWGKYSEPVVTVKTGENRFEHRDIEGLADLIETLETSIWVHARFALALEVEPDGSALKSSIPVDESMQELWESMNPPSPAEVLCATVSVENADQRYGSKFDVTIESDWGDAVLVLVAFWDEWSRTKASEPDDAVYPDTHFRELGFPNTRLASESLKELISTAEGYLVAMADRNEHWRLEGSDGDAGYGSIEQRTPDGFYERHQFVVGDEFFATHDDPDAGWSVMRWDARVEAETSGDMVGVVASVGIAAHWDSGAHTITFHSTDLDLLSKLVNVARSAAVGASMKIRPMVFIGHGRSQDWSSVNLFLRSLGLDTDYFEAAPRAGLEASAIVVDMVQSANFAVIVMTAEDEASEDVATTEITPPATRMRARQNVIHELGLAQGVLGVSRVVMLVEHGIEILSNVISIQQIRYQTGRVADTFNELRSTVEREFPGAFDNDARPGVGKVQLRYPWPDAGGHP